MSGVGEGEAAVTSCERQSQRKTAKGVRVAVS